MSLKKTSLFIFLLAIIFGFWKCSSNDQKVNKSTKISKNTYANLHDSAKYVGIKTCENCHPKIVESFSHTGMGKSFDQASLQKSSAIFDKHAVIFDEELNLHYQAKLQNDELFIVEYQLNGRDTIHKRIEKINYVIGSGQHTNSHIFNVNGYLYQMPMTFYTQSKKWDLPPGFETGNSRFGRLIEAECMTCHNGYPEIVDGSLNKYTKIPNGIDCERCHGPGSIHVEEKKAGNFVDVKNEIDYSIVNPSKLPLDLQISLCQRCHLQGNAVLKPNKTFFDFKPGMKLSDVLSVFLPRFEGDQESFIMASHADRMMQSQCFQVSQKMSCITCHNPHESVELVEENYFNKSCISCHTNEKEDCSLPFEKRIEKNNNCVSCHMPKSGSIDIPHVSITDHFIRKPIENKNKEAIKKFIGLASINEKNPNDLTKGIAYLQYFERFESDEKYLDSAQNYLVKAKTKKADDEVFKALIHLFYLRGEAQYLITLAKNKQNALNIKDAWTIYRIGDAFYALGNLLETYKYFQKAIELMPYNLEFQNKYGSLLIDLKRFSEAKNTFDFILKENPKFAPAWCNLGFANLNLQNIESANCCYEKAIELNPNYEQAWLNKLGLFMFQNDKIAAQKLFVKIKRQFPENPQLSLIEKEIFP